MRAFARRLIRWMLVALLVTLSSIGIPALLSLARPNRERGDVTIALVVGEDLPRI